MTEQTAAARAKSPEKTYIAAFQTALRARAAQVEARLDGALAALETPLEQNAAAQTAELRAPQRLLAAMRHGVFNGGKRLRPFLLLECAALFAPAPALAQPAKTQTAALECAAALEAVHCYSLIHDDLPAMDDDDWRRGRPAVHKAYDEATAILAGNALFTLGFQLINAAGQDSKAPIDAAKAAQLSLLLAQAAGAAGMVGGQMLDILAEKQAKSAEEIITLEMMKTGALLRFACLAGAVIAGADAQMQALMARFGAGIGFSFQLADDILDTTGNQRALGKTPGKDRDAGKATLVALYGLDKARRLLAAKTEEAQDMLSPFGEKADILRQAAHFIAYRDH